ncbi:MAG TPA: poly-beta-1,6-N-acetyl-D-glucosamine biosynthesis protein PgaD [Thermoanaerobaculia bacterium]|jgi:poly-beta-1,6-N-acetyl-D-glucosamine biosynthesis protein PgaD|nr:poly-beta-1,6-N-acetyl-D-glucosamine biosynthesis protein PgaD [Thermoanaerobaculia bacterium]
MPSGKVPIAESSTVGALLARHWSHRRPLPTGVLALITALFWAAWLYLVLPLVSLLLWALGVRFFIQQMRQSGYEALRSSLIAYSSVLLILIGLLAVWIVWNMARYGGSRDRRTARRGALADSDIQAAFRLDDSLLPVLRHERLVRIDLDSDGCPLVIAGTRPHLANPAAGASADGAGPQRISEVL